MIDDEQTFKLDSQSRVNIKYEVETEQGVLSKELPFVVGVMGDFSGDSSKTKNISERKFIQIDKDNFDLVMKKISPELNFNVKNVISEKEENLAVNLKFNSLNNFSPDSIIEQIPYLKKLLDLRNQLSELISQADISENLEATLEEILSNYKNNENEA